MNMKNGSIKKEIKDEMRKRRQQRGLGYRKSNERMFTDLFKIYLSLSDKLRPKYSTSLGKTNNDWENYMKVSSIVPDLYQTIYCNVAGTERNIQDQYLMDFIPGYRLIHISEFANEMKNLDSILSKGDLLKAKTTLPLLTNYSNDFICYYRTNGSEEKICIIFHDQGELVEMYKSPLNFLETICEFYNNQVYFLDDDGYLDYDMEKEGNIGAKLNPEVKYWIE